MTCTILLYVWKCTSSTIHLEGLYTPTGDAVAMNTMSATTPTVSLQCTCFCKDKRKKNHRRFSKRRRRLNRAYSARDTFVPKSEKSPALHRHHHKKLGYCTFCTCTPRKRRRGDPSGRRLLQLHGGGVQSI